MLIFNKKGFTLAEILITLIVIGVIAAMTIPSLIQNSNEEKYKAAWKKNFALVSQASTRIALDNGFDFTGVFGANVNDNDVFMNRFGDYLVITKKCFDNGAPPTGSNGCWPEKVQQLSGGEYTTLNFSTFSRAELANGALMAFDFTNTNCDSDRPPNDDGCGFIYIDVNGFQNPNTIGKDIYALWITKPGKVIPYGAKGDYYYALPADYSCNVNAYPAAKGQNCSADFLRNVSY